MFTAQPVKINTPNPINLHFAGVYKDGGIRELAHVMREQHIMYDRAAMLMAPLVPEKAVLIPVPGHEGGRGMAHELTEWLARYTGVPVADVLTGTPRPSSYELKKKGVFISKDEMSFDLKGPLPPGYQPVVVDNVSASGQTALAALEVVGGNRILVLGDDPMAIGRSPEWNAAYNDVIRRRDRISGISFYRSHYNNGIYIRAKIDGVQQMGCRVDKEFVRMLQELKGTGLEGLFPILLAEKYYTRLLQQQISRAFSPGR